MEPDAQSWGGAGREGKGGRACRTAVGCPAVLPDEAGVAAGPGAVSTRQMASLLVDVWMGLRIFVCDVSQGCGKCGLA